jgi:NAD-dependent dihydropyrimidine dehydrogenase PreA subunit
MIGFCYPTHGFGIPWFMLKFIARFPRRERGDVFLLNTRAGAKIGRLFLPGVSGIAQLLPALILLAKGFRIRGLFPLDMPSNWISLHPGYSPPTVAAISARCRVMVDGFCGNVLQGRFCLRPNVLLMLPIDIALAPIAFMYFMYGRFFFAKLYVASSGCDACGLCEKKCPTASIRMVGGRPFWKFSCESCMRCINVCPRQAIQVSHLLAVLIVVASSFLPFALVLKGMNAHIPAALKGTADFLANWGMSLSLFFIASGLVFWLMRMRTANRLFTFTSLTKYWRRYMAPGIKARDF